MFRISRLMLVVSVMEAVYCLAIFSMKVSPLPLLIPLVLIGVEKMLRQKSGWAHGTAEWSSEKELRRKGMIGGNTGLAIGRLAGGTMTPMTSDLLSVVDARVSAPEACERFFKSLLCKLLMVRKPGEVVRLSRAVHTAVFGITGAGKGASFIIPWLLEMNESAVVLDFKGENAGLTARHRERHFGHRCVLLDPFLVVTRHPDCFNPIDQIVLESETVIDDSRDLAEQLVVRAEGERERHWNDSAEAWIAAAITAVTLNTDTDNRSLQTVRAILSDPERLQLLIEFLRERGGMLARIGGQLAHYRDKELSSTLTTANRHLRFLDTPAVAASTCSSTFDPKELRNGKMTIYCILPPEHMRAQAALMRMWVGSLMRSVVRGGLQHG